MCANKKERLPGSTGRLYYSFTSGGIRARLLESIIDTNFLNFYINNHSVSESYIIETLSINPVRARKWLNLLVNEEFIEKAEKDEDIYYALGKLGKILFEDMKVDGWECKHIVKTWKQIAYANLSVVLQEYSPKTKLWPPQTSAAAVALEEWMTQSSRPAIYALEDTLDFSNIKNLLDVGGGEGTIACALARQNPTLKVSVYNLPYSVALATKKIEDSGLSEQVKVIEGDFIKDNSFPRGFDTILFSRVLWDWSLEMDKKLLQMAYEALPPGGQVAICEAFRENNRDLALAKEYRYIFWDEVDTAVFKTSDVYKALLIELGFKNITLNHNDNPYSVIMAEK